MSKHVEGPDFDRMAESRQIIKEVREDREELKRLRNLNADMLAALRSINRTTSPGTRTLDDFIRDMGWACDEARRAIAKAETAP